MWRLVLAACLINGATSLPVHDSITPSEGEKCGYESCPKAEDGVLNVHIVPHTHDDVGWLKTVDQYYFGSRNNIQKAGVQYILDSVIRELWEDPKRRFIYVETAFFWKWWLRQSDHIRHRVHALVRQGRLEFIGGAWSMNDEAAAHYQSTIDQFTFGLRKLNDTFGECGRPKIGWQIDPFGHAREFASTLAGIGFDGLFLGRIDYQDKAKRLADKSLEMIWRGDDDLGKPSDIFTGVLYNHYSPPSGFCFDVLCDDEPIIDDVDSPMYNVDKRLSDFLKFCEEQSKHVRTNNILLTMGGDFTYQDAAMWYKNLDKLILYTNLKATKDDLKVKLFYSTPSCYLKAVKEANPTLPTKQDDFFPYASDSTAYWTGYFTSRPTTKYFERLGNNYLQGVKQLQILANLEDHNRFFIHELSDAMGVMQHHDAITGTEKQHVTHDYERILTEAIDDALSVTRQAFNKISQGDIFKSPLLSYERCEMNQSQCYTSENSQHFVLTLYNPLGWKVTAPIRVPVIDAAYTVYGPDGKEIEIQLAKLSPQAINIPTRSSKATHEIVFFAENLPALGFKQYYVKKQIKVKRNIQADEDYLKKKNKNIYYDNINDYWKGIKQQSYVDIKEFKSIDNVKDKSIERIEDKIPDEPVKFGKNQVNTNNDNYLELGLQILKDNKDAALDEDIIELEKMIREARKSLEEVPQDLSRNRDEDKVKYPVLNEEEMRMLSDDPRIVERHENVLENEHYKIKIDENTGDITDVILPDGTEFKFSCSVVYYIGCVGDNSSPSNRSSGAYIFRPNGTKSDEANKLSLGKITKGSIFDQIEYDFEFGTLEVKLYKHSDIDNMEVTWTVGIDIADNLGKEVAILFKTDIINNGEFYTDSSGRQMIKRKLDKRPQYPVNLEEPVPGNYYPVTNKISINDGKKYFSILTDRSQGGSSLQEGNLELMVHRRLLHDDAFGVGEALNETAFGKGLVARGNHYLFFKPMTKENIVKERKYVFEHHLPPQVFVSDAKDLNFDKWLSLKNEFGGLKKDLPEGLHLLTLEPWKGDTLLLRFENYYEKADKEKTDVEIDISDLFSSLKIFNISETNLAANQWLTDTEKWQWQAEGEFVNNFNEDYNDSLSPKICAKDDNKNPKEITDFKIELNAKQIRTFVIKYKFEKE